MAKIRVAVIFGGRSGEHEVSLMSAKSVLSALSPDKYEVTPVAITKEGKWRVAKNALEMLKRGELANIRDDSALVDSEELSLVPEPTSDQPFDVVFPVLHGPYGEDGTIQGFLELANIPYVGAGVTASAVSMDKAIMRVLFADAKLPLVPWLTVLRSDYQKDPQSVVDRITASLGFPCFVKPANLGSSVGISKATDEQTLKAALELAGEFDRKLVVEQGLSKPREIECSVLGNDNPIPSVPGEVIPGNDFYDYESKYIKDDSQLMIPASLSDSQVETIQDYAIRAYRGVDCQGMARVDFFLTQDGQILVNEINTIPGFTRISMYPKLWEASGMPFDRLVDELIQLAIKRHQERQGLRTNFSTD